MATRGDHFERKKLVLFTRESTQYAEQIGVVVVLQNVAHFGNVVQREQCNVFVAFLWCALLRDGVWAFGSIQQLQPRLTNLKKSNFKLFFKRKILF